VKDADDDVDGDIAGVREKRGESLTLGVIEMVGVTDRRVDAVTLPDTDRREDGDTETLDDFCGDTVRDNVGDDVEQVLTDVDRDAAAERET
jgi:hypothetical protein